MGRPFSITKPPGTKAFRAPCPLKLSTFCCSRRRKPACPVENDFEGDVKDSGGVFKDVEGDVKDYKGNVK